MTNQTSRIQHYSQNLFAWVSDSIYRPRNYVIQMMTRLQVKLGRKFRESNQDTRRINYNYQLLPNPVLAQREQQTHSSEDFVGNTGYSVGYPSWNLLYYSLYSSLHFTDKRLPIILETGTNEGYSTIVMAQVLRDLQIPAKILSVEWHAENAEIARRNIEQAGLSDYVEIHVGDALAFLRECVQKYDHIDFVFLDDNHEYPHVRYEFDIIYRAVLACKGKVYFDNTARGGVKRTLDYIRRAYGGNIVEFLNCSWSPPGNAIWQP
jgi:tRNA G46 methylase TrmB